MNESSTPPSDATADPMVGQLLAGRYRIISKLGEGAMGAVYLGEHVRMGRRDAIKVLRRDIGHDAEAMSRFVRGARNVSLIRHPNVCTIYDFSDTAEGQQFLAMEFIEGETLKDVLDREGRLELMRALRITGDVADALQAAHEAGVIHRDLKPGNVMITPRAGGGEAVKVVDFDIAKGPEEKEAEEVTRLGFVVGTPEYMSPEQLMGERLDGRSDLYSLAVMLFRMLTAALPFRATATQEMMIERLTTPPLRLDEALPDANLPPGLADVIAKALSRRREDRQEGTAAFAAELQAAVAGTAAAHGATAAAAAQPPDLAATVRQTAASPNTPEGVPPTLVVPAGSLPQALPRQPAHSDQPGPTGQLQAARKPSRAVMAAAAVALIVVVAVGAIALVAPFGGGDRVTVAPGSPPSDVGDAGPSSGVPNTDGGPQTLEQTPGTGRTPEGGTPPDAGSAQDGGRTQDTDARPGIPRPAPPVVAPSALPGSVAEVLDRQLALLAGNPGPAVLRAISDTASIAWDLAVSRADSATAAITLAQAALTAGNDEECRRWARRAAGLGAVGAGTLVQVCG